MPSPSPLHSLPVHPLLRVLDAQLTADDRLALQEFLRGAVGSKVVKALLIATPSPTSPGMATGIDSVFRSGEVKGWTAAVDYLVLLTEREEAAPRVVENFPDIDNADLWEGDKPKAS